jgi:hypothetical protein
MTVFWNCTKVMEQVIEIVVEKPVLRTKNRDKKESHGQKSKVCAWGLQMESTGRHTLSKCRLLREPIEPTKGPTEPCIYPTLFASALFFFLPFVSLKDTTW